MMKPSKPFLFCLALLAVAGATTFLNAPTARADSATGAMPLSTRLTPAMIDHFGLEVAYDHPSIAGLVACQAQPACGGSDSSSVRFLDTRGSVVPMWDGKPGSVIELVRHRNGTDAKGGVLTRTLRRHFAVDEQGRVVMNGVDTIVTVDSGAPRRGASRVVRINRYADVRYLMSDPRFVWPLKGLVVLELSSTPGIASESLVRPAGHAAVGFDGTASAHIITTGSLMHRADLAAKRLETSVPVR